MIETVAWTAKEAAVKALGTGLDRPLHDVVISELHAGGALAIEAAGRSLRAHFERRADRVITLALA